MQPIVHSRRGSFHRARLLALSLALATSVALLAAGSAAAGSPCDIHSYTPTDNDVTAYGKAYIDCPSSPTAKSLRVTLREWIGPFYSVHADQTWTNLNTSNRVTKTVSTNCDNHGTDDWQVFSYGTDNNGGNTGWESGGVGTLTC